MGAVWKVFLAAAVMVGAVAAGAGADELTDRVIYVTAELGCAFPYVLTENATNGRFFAETKVEDPQKLKNRGFSDVTRGSYVAIQESAPNRYLVRVAADLDKLYKAEARTVTLERTRPAPSFNQYVVSNVALRGVISDWEGLAAFVSARTCLQLVPIPADGTLEQTIEDGFVNLASNFPRLRVPPSGAFEYRLPGLEAGTYTFYLQNFQPAGEGPPPLDGRLYKGDRVLQIVIPQDINSLIYNCGTLSVRIKK